MEPLAPLNPIFPDVCADRASSRIRERIFRVDHPNWADESISLSDYCLEKPRSVGVVAQRRAKLPHNVVDVSFSIDKQIGAPQLLHDVVAGDHLLTALEQKDQQLHGLLLELDPPPRPPQFVAAQVDFDFTATLFQMPHGEPLASIIR
jgi:hypothetical protein